MTEEDEKFYALLTAASLSDAGMKALCELALDQPANPVGVDHLRQIDLAALGDDGRVHLNNAGRLVAKHLAAAVANP